MVGIIRKPAVARVGLLIAYDTVGTPLSSREKMACYGSQVLRLRRGTGSDGSRI